MRSYAIAGDSPDTIRAARIADRLSRARPLPVDAVFVFSSSFKKAKLDAKGLRISEINAGAARCGIGNPPRFGCIYIGDRLLTVLSDDALAGVLAHELGHLERGHKAASHEWRDFARQGLASALIAARSQLPHEHEADAAALERLTAAGYCAREVMREMLAMLPAIRGGQDSGGLLSDHPSLQERANSLGQAPC